MWIAREHSWSSASFFLALALAIPFCKFSLPPLFRAAALSFFLVALLILPVLHRFPRELGTPSQPLDDTRKWERKRWFAWKREIEERAINTIAHSCTLYKIHPLTLLCMYVRRPLEIPLEQIDWYHVSHGLRFCDFAISRKTVHMHLIEIQTIAYFSFSLSLSFSLTHFLSDSLHRLPMCADRASIFPWMPH